MVTLFASAIFFTPAFPATVMAAIPLVIRILKSIWLTSGFLSKIIKIIVAPIEPLSIPVTSPITSWQMFETLSTFLTRDKAWDAPLIFFEAIVVKGTSEHEVTATPMRSNSKCIRIIIIRRTKAIIRFTLLRIVSDMKLKRAAEANVKKRIIKIQRVIFLRCLFDLLFALTNRFTSKTIKMVIRQVNFAA
jgi:hypothetical protein